MRLGFAVLTSAVGIYQCVGIPTAHSHKPYTHKILMLPLVGSNLTVFNAHGLCEYITNQEKKYPVLELILEILS